MSASEAVVLVTGATGKVGQQFIGRFLADEGWSGARVRALPQPAARGKRAPAGRAWLYL